MPAADQVGQLALPELCASSCHLPWMEKAHNTTGTEELCVGVCGEEQKVCALIGSQAKDLFHMSRPNSAKHHKTKSQVPVTALK